jgi:ketosteroid isomerase-like protein
MDQESLEVVRRWRDAIQRGDLAEHLWDPNLEIVNAEGWALEATYRGHEGLRRWWSDLEEAFSEFRLEVDEVTSLNGGRVLTAQRFVGRFRTTDIPFDGAWASVLTVRGGRIVHAVGYLSKQRALRALEEA